jgi:phosphoribosylglycinamide formyltransferase-1
MIILSGYMQLIGDDTMHTVGGRVINIHPSLLPKYGGKGMYGSHVHQAVKDNNETQTGITIHQVSEKYDEGKILAQKIIPLNIDESTTDIEKKVRAAEPDFYIETLRRILKKEIELD